MRQYFLLALLPILTVSCTHHAEQTMPSREDTIPVHLIALNGEASRGFVLASGTLSTESQARLSFKTGGVIDRVMVKEGERVHHGQLLATLKSTEIIAQVNQVRLQVEKAHRDFNRVQNLYRDSVATLEQLQNARTGMQIAEQALQQAEFNEQYSRIYAPQDGFVVKKMKNEGELAEAGGPVLFISAVSGSSKWILSAGLSDREWAELKQGDPAEVTVEAFPGKSFHAIVSKRALAADPTSGSFQIEIQVDFGNLQPAIGMFGKARIITGHETRSFSIPYESLLEANGNKGYVFASTDGKSVQRVEVVVGRIGEKSVEIQSGLEGFTYVVSSGSPYLTDKSLIRPIP
jgi:membrane fusion protein, multidrug efflux system